MCACPWQTGTDHKRAWPRGQTGTYLQIRWKRLNVPQLDLVPVVRREHGVYIKKETPCFFEQGTTRDFVVLHRLHTALQHLAHVACELSGQGAGGRGSGCGGGVGGSEGRKTEEEEADSSESCAPCLQIFLR